MNNQEENIDPWKRDEDGDIVPFLTSDEDREKSKIYQNTYIFHLWHEDKENDDYSDYYTVVNDFTEDAHWAFPNLLTKVHHIFQLPTYPAKQNELSNVLANIKKYEALLNKYFPDVLAFYPQEEVEGPKIQKCRLIMADSTFHDIIKFIKKFNLIEHSDFIFLLISKMEKMYINGIARSERPSEVHRINNFPKQIQKLISVLELSDNNNYHKWDYTQGLPPELEKIVFKFKFNNIKTFSIEDSHLLSYIPDAIRDKYNNGSFKNWKKQLNAFPAIYTENEKKHNYRYRLTKALNNFFISENIFPLKKGKNTNDDGLKCIAFLFHFANMPITDKKGNKIDIQNDTDIQRIFRNYINRKEKLEQKIHEVNIIEAKDVLYKYFDKELIDSVNNTHQVYNLNQVTQICVRFEIYQLMPAFAHLFKILLYQSHDFMYQWSQLTLSSKKHPEYYNFIKLAKSFENCNTKHLDKVNIVLKDKTEINLSSSLLLDLLGKAINNYFNNNSIDFRTDLTKNQGENIVLKEPAERFLPQFCLSFHNMLKGELKLTRHDLEPSLKYFTIIGLLVQLVPFFSLNHQSEKYMVEKVKEWITTAKIK